MNAESFRIFRRGVLSPASLQKGGARSGRIVKGFPVIAEEKIYKARCSIPISLLRTGSPPLVKGGGGGEYAP
ncbi:MAG: hypothetical protein V5A47_05625 [Bacteroidales bacterium]